MKFLLPGILGAVVLSGCCAEKCDKTAVVLAEHGGSAYEIAIEPRADQVQRYAAEELRHWLKALSGAELPLSRNLFSEKPRIVLAVNPRNFPEDVKALQGSDGYAVRRSKNDIYIIGTSSKGVLNGVYRWLYRNSDIIWARPNAEFGTIFTRQDRLVFHENDYLDLPKFQIRGWQMIGNGLQMPSEIWQARNGANWSASARSASSPTEKLGFIRECGGGHNLTRLYMTEEKYFDAHPEYFPLIQGRRQRPSAHVPHRTQLCFTNQGGLKAFIRELDAQVRKHPDFSVYRVMIEDNYVLCECPDCLAPIKLPDGSLLEKDAENFRSTQFFIWFNELAKFMREAHPGKKLRSFGYFFTEPAPAVKVDPIIEIALCPIYKNSKHIVTAPQNEETFAKLDSWLARTDQIIWREYFGLQGPYPRPIDRIALADWKYVLNRGMNKTYSEMYADAPGSRMDGDASWNINMPIFWTLANGAWDPGRGADGLRREFFRRVYGPAAPDVEEFYRITDECFSGTGGFSDWQDRTSGLWRSVVRSGRADACRAALERAWDKRELLHPNAKIMLKRLKDETNRQLENAKIFGLDVVCATSPVLFDPTFSHGDWSRAHVDRVFTRRGGTPHDFKQDVRVMYDEKNLYIGIRCCTDPSKIRCLSAGQPRDKFPRGEKVEIFLTGRNQDGVACIYQIAFDRNGNLFDACDRKAKWNGLYEYKTAVTADGWSAYLAVPWTTLKLDIAALPELGMMVLCYRTAGKLDTSVGFWRDGAPYSLTSFGELRLKRDIK